MPPTPTATPLPPTPTRTVAAAVPLHLTGTGQQASAPLTLRAGLTTVNSGQRGQFNFIAELLDASGQQVALLANVIGSVSSSTAFRVPSAGQYVVNVRAADGPWAINLVQLGSAELAQAVPLPRTFTGTNNQNTPLFVGRAGAVRDAARHRGQANFIVKVLDADGQEVALAVNGIGDVDASQVFPLPEDGVYVLVVIADGAWTIQLSQ